ncbi:hypothetical protein [Sneathiella sp.]|uniref:hypothetical protein n=1 Tax=Sneathiella sp. TaxID=1964365 RepID=UPI0026371A1F|nr:hypothetical protein [Sneathiella sp.]MDF2368867.1 hypothetical protein [Sneathiella sp.]
MFFTEEENIWEQPDKKGNRALDKRKIKPDKPVITVDYEHYAHFLAGTDWTEEQKQEYLQTIWNITCELVSLGIGVHPLQQIENGCGKIPDNAEQPALLTPDMLEYRDTGITSIFKETTQSVVSEQEGGGKA